MAEGGGGGHWIGSALATLPTGNLRWLLQQLAAVIIMMLCVMFMNIIGATLELSIGGTVITRCIRMYMYEAART